jgi:heme exporter protein C
MKRALTVFGLMLCAAGFIVLPLLAIERAPVAYELGFNQKIFYYHVPAAMAGFAAVLVCGVASIGYLVTRRPGWDDAAGAAGELAVLFGLIVLITGPIWAKVAWGVWWVWEARLMLMALMWMIFVAYALVRRFGGPGSERLAAGLAIFGMADMPLVYFAVNFWRTQHPTNNVVPSLRGPMMMAFLVGLASFLVLFVLYLVAIRSVRRGERQLAEIGDAAVDAGIID